MMMCCKSGSVGFIATGWGVSGLPDPHLGFVYFPALAGIVIPSMLLAPVGAAVAHRLPTKRLRQIFAVMLYLFATRMLISLL